LWTPSSIAIAVAWRESRRASRDSVFVLVVLVVLVVLGAVASEFELVTETSPTSQPPR
jgi:hypothetical protein